MKLIRNSLPFALVAVLAGPTASSSKAATLMVDWLTVESETAPSAFSLMNDAGLPVVTGELAIAADQGILFPGFPQNRLLNANFWAVAPTTVDSMAGNGQVSAIDFRVVPENGAATYTIELSVPAGQPLVLAVGGLYRGATGATDSVSLSASSDDGVGSVELLEILSWDNGLTAYNHDFEWEAATATFSTTEGSEGDSEIGFVRVAPILGSNPRIILSVPQGYAAGTGDTVTVAVGLVIPEPASAMLLGLTGLVVISRRRR